MDNDISQKSRTQIKKEAHNLQDLGEKLMSLTQAQLAAIDIPQELKEAVSDALSIRSNQAKRRQIQYIGALMRKIDPEPIYQALSMLEAGLTLKSESDSEKTHWARGLADGDDALFDTVFSRCPDTDGQRLRQLVRNARKAKGSPKQAKAYKQLLRYLKELD